MRAPELRGRRWLNTGGAELTLADLRGKIVLLDFWTFCCVNCLHVLDELRELEERYADVLVTIGVHSPKFAHEADPDAVAAAVERYGVHHPVLDDPELRTWDAYAARAWPTLVVIDPDAATSSRRCPVRGTRTASRVLVEELVAEHADVPLRRGDGPYVAPPEPATALRFPGKVDRAPRRRASWFRHRPPPARRAGARPGHGAAADRHRASAGWWTAGAAGSTSRWGCSCSRTATAGGRQRQPRPAPGPAGRRRRHHRGGHRRAAPRPGRAGRDRGRAVDAVGPGLVGRARGGRDGGQPPALDLATRPPARRPRGRAPPTRDCATGRPPRRSSPSPPGSRWATACCGWPTPRPPRCARCADGLVATAVGQGLFDFGHRDGPADQALFQHPLGVAVLPDGSVARRRHLQRRGPPLRPGDARRSAPWRPSWPSRATSSWTATRSWSSSRPRTGWSGCRSRRRSGWRARAAGAPGGHRRRARPPRAPGGVRPAHRPAPRHPVRRSDRAHGGGLPAGAAGRGRGHGAGAVRGSSRWATCPRACCRSASRRPRATRATACSPPATATSRTGASRCGSWRARPPSWCWICARSERRRNCRWPV